ncbi:tRNA (adenosine(37)-N6)-threonylcarbamoyltransferase complex dimerization subunit type 1 TsaB [Ornithinimicrobium sp.]|uniref:tRNA (adenosine(37)-N6)-threonylcarbamoyltransferase complex dimerization subunit type 1 TsaB n=1 Tax=Ornithinimicrobium sp. TaxID=1977084 RepID=UPI002B482EC1|nr:tRNA (adenosine(37)-N6)-threonylcarbamoyltransferase complex dimerization subunit type 1 TsaB [Ornithinimicrobium sp.]
MLLAMDTSTSLVGAACLSGETVLSQVTEADSRRHAELLAPAVERALAQAGRAAGDVREVVTGVGPAPFTGLRVGIVTARVMARALRVPVYGVCSLDALAAQAQEWLSGHGANGETEILVATDARRQEVYWARYTVGPHGVRRHGEPAVGRADAIPEEVRDLPCAGRGPLLYPQALHPLAPLGDRAEPDLMDVQPSTVGRLATQARHRRSPEPLYLRRPDAQPRRAAPAPVSASS